MKFALAILFAVSTSTALLFSQETAPAPAANGEQADIPGHEKMRGMMREKFLENLPPDVRARFEAAREKVMQDPKIKELKAKADSATGELRAAVREAMMKADPGLADLLKQNVGNKFKAGKDGGKPGAEHPNLDQLSDADRKKLMAARETAKADPTVQAAEEKRKAAATPEDRRAAEEEFHKAIRAAVLKADPSLEPILNQLKGQKGQMRGNGPNGQNPGAEQSVPQT